MRNNLPQQQGLDHFLVQSTTKCQLLFVFQSDLPALTGASFTLHARVEIGSPETFLVTKLLTVNCSSWAGYRGQQNVYVRQSHSMWNSCHADDTLKAQRYL